jgi:hypothetical protein
VRTVTGAAFWILLAIGVAALVFWIIGLLDLIRASGECNAAQHQLLFLRGIKRLAVATLLSLVSWPQILS